MLFGVNFDYILVVEVKDALRLKIMMILTGLESFCLILKRRRFPARILTITGQSKYDE